MSFGSPVSRGACALALTCALAAAPSRVRGGDEPSPDAEAPVELPEVVVRVPRAATIVEPTAAATVVPAERYAGEAKGVAELLAASPGVEVTRYGARGQATTVQIRGVDADGVKVLLDGLPLGSAGGGIDLTTIPRAWIERVEVLRGPSAADLGAGALGGAVNVVTRDARAGAASGELTGGSFGTYSASAEGAGRAGPLTIFAGATGETTRGDFPYLYDDRPDLPGNPLQPTTRLNDASRRAGLLVKLGGPVGALRLDALAQASGGHRELPGPALAPGAPPPTDWMDDGRALAMARIGADVAPGVTLAARVHGRWDLLDTRLAELGAAPDRQRGGAGGAALEARVAHPGGVLALGVEAAGEGWSSAVLGGTRARATVAASADEGWVAIAGRLRVNPAVRVERVGPFDGTSAKLGAALRLVDGLTLRASGGRTYRVPSVAELYLQQGLLAPNPDLRPETGTGADAALAYDGPLGVASVGGHATVYDDLITYEPASFARFKPFNTIRALAAGLEAEAATAPAPRLLGLSLQGAYTFLHTETLRATAQILGNALPRRPRHRLEARAAIAPGRFGAHVDVHVLRDAWQDSYNTRRIPDETVLSAGASVLLVRAPRLALHVEIENVGDARALLDGFGQPLPGRTLIVSLRAGSSTQGTP